MSGADILGFLRTFEGAAATFSEGNGHWSLWLPEFSPDGHPLTPASQIFFPVILRRDDQAFAIRFFYDCSTGKVRYYTSAIPEEIARRPELENAISELFRHSLPVEAIRQRSLGRKSRRPSNDAPLEPRPVHRQSLADPDDRSVPAAVYAPPAAEPSVNPPPPVSPEQVALPAPSSAPKVVALAPTPQPPAPIERPPIYPAASPRPVMPIVPKPVAGALIEVAPAGPPPASRSREITRTVRVELGPRARSVLMMIIVTVGTALIAGIGAYVYLEATRDAGVEHHRLQIEEMRLRNGG